MKVGANFSASVSVNGTRDVITADIPAAAAPGPVDVTVTSSTAGTTVKTGAYTYLVAGTRFASGSPTQDVAAVDLNADNKVDIAIVNGAPSNRVNVFLNTSSVGTATPTLAAASALTMAHSPYGIVIADLNANGRPDIATLNGFGESFSTFINNTTVGASTPSFGSEVETGTSLTTAASLRAADLNGDGKADLAMAAQITSGGAPKLSVLVNQTTVGSATLSFASRADFSAGTSGKAADLVLGDVDGDGKLDAVLVVDGATTQSIAILRNTSAAGSLSFAAPVSVNPGQPTNTGPAFGFACRRIALADINVDGKLDIVFSRPDSVSGPSTSATVLMNTSVGSISFGAPSHFTVGTGPTAVVAGDLGSGRADVVVLSRLGALAAAFNNATSTGAATPSLTPRKDVGCDFEPCAAALADVNRDGDLDLITTARDGNLSIFLNALLH